MVALEIEQWSAKVREGGPNGPGDDDSARAGTAGVLAVGRGDSSATGAGRARAAERGEAAPSLAAPPSSGPTVYFAVRMVPGPEWNAALPMRSQAGWTDHAAFMDQLAAEGFIVLGGPLGGGEVKLHIVQAPSEAAVRSRLAADPWSVSRQLDVWDVRPWTILLDGRSAAPRP